MKKASKNSSTDVHASGSFGNCWIMQRRKVLEIGDGGGGSFYYETTRTGGFCASCYGERRDNMCDVRRRDARAAKDREKYEKIFVAFARRFRFEYLVTVIQVGCSG